MTTQYTTIHDFVDELYTNPFTRNVPLDTIVRHCVNFMKIVGTPDMFLTKTEIIPISEYKGNLPCDFYRMTQVRSASNKFHEIVYRAATDSFHTAPKLASDENVSAGNTLLQEEQTFSRKERLTEFTYTIQGHVIYTSTEDIDIEIAYKAIAVDKDGIPLIPDTPSFTRALKNYILKEILTVLFYEGKVNQAVLQNAQQEYAFSVGDCQSEFNRMTIDEAESFYNMWSQLLIKTNDHSRHFEGTGRREKMKRL